MRLYECNPINLLEPSTRPWGGSVSAWATQSSRGSAGKFLLFVDLGHLGGQVLGVAVTQFLNCINAGAFQKFAVLFADTLDTTQSNYVYPLQDL